MELLSWVVLGSKMAVELRVMDIVFQRLDWGGRTCFQDSTLTWHSAEAADPCHVCLSIGAD